jgi:catechol 2,3-dioxygenase-like lactoylglutathione lyase family enzyme
LILAMQIDHVTVCGSDLERMQQLFADVGLATEFGGAHANGLTHMALAGFRDGSYLELIAPLAGGDLGKATGMIAGWMPLMQGNAGPGAWAIQVSGIREKTAALRAAGIEVRGPEPGGRTKPDGTVLEWETTVVGPGSAGSVLPFMIEDRTRRGLRVQPSDHELDVQGVAGVIIAVRDLKAAVHFFQQAYGWETSDIEDRADFGARVTRFTGTPVILAEGIGDSWLVERVNTFGECPAAFLLAAGNPLSQRPENWSGQQIWWLDRETLGGARIGLVARG